MCSILNNVMGIQIFLFLLWNAWKLVHYLKCCRWILELPLVHSTYLKWNTLAFWVTQRTYCVFVRMHMFCVWRSWCGIPRWTYRAHPVSENFDPSVTFEIWEVRNKHFFFVCTLPLGVTFIMCVSISNHRQHCFVIVYCMDTSLDLV
jgi:hypothetical protein